MGSHQPVVFYLDATVHDDGEPHRLCPGRRGVITKIELHPDRLRQRQNGERFVNDPGKRILPPEDVDEIDGLRNVGELRVNPLAKNLLAGLSWVDGDDMESGEQEILHHAVHRAHPVRRCANHGNGVDRAKESL